MLQEMSRVYEDVLEDIYALDLHPLPLVERGKYQFKLIGDLNL